MDSTRVYRIGGRPYHKGGFIPPNNRQTLDDRLQPRGISTSSNSSWTYSNSHLEFPKQKRRKICGSFLIAAIFVVASAVLTIGGLAIYLGAVKIEPSNLLFDGSLRITYGDQYQTALSNISSKLFLEKSQKYQDMIMSVLQKTVLKPALKSVDVFHFQNGSLILNFRINLDRRKVPDVDVEEVIRTALLEDFASLKPVAFRNIQVDTKSLIITRHQSDSKTKVIRKLPGTTAASEITTEKILIPVTGSSVKIDALAETIQLKNKPDFTSKEGIGSNHKVYQAFNITSASMKVIKNNTEPHSTASTTARTTATTTTTTTTTTTMTPSTTTAQTTTREINGHAKPLLEEEPWRPIIPSRPAVVQPMPQTTEEDIVTVDPEKPITFSKEVYEQNLKIAPEYNKKIKNSKLSKIAEEIAKKYKDMLKHQDIETTSQLTIDNSRSSSLVNFELPELPLLKQFHDLDSLLNTFSSNNQTTMNTTSTTSTTSTTTTTTAATTLTSPTKTTTTTAATTTAKATATTAPLKSLTTPKTVIARFPERKRVSTERIPKDETVFIEVSTVSPRKVTPVGSFEIKGEVEVLDGTTSDSPVLVTLLPVRSNVNMKSPLRPRPERRGKVRREFVDDEGGKRWVYYSSSRITTETPKKVFIVTPETKASNASDLSIYNTIETLLNTDFRERNPVQNQSSVEKIVQNLENVALTIGSSSEVILKGIKVNQDEISTKNIGSGYKLNQAGVPILTKLLNKDPDFSHKNPLNEGISSHLNPTECGNTTIKCSNGICLPQTSRCNQLVDCPDASDEKNCTCAEHLLARKQNRKICDGIVDCWDFSDEYNCEWCKPGQYLCSGSKKCIDFNKTCDGIAQCPESDDEAKCVTIAPPDFLDQPNLLKHPYHSSGNLMVRKHGEWGFLCVQDFEQVAKESHTGWKFSDLGRSICKALTYRDFDQVETMSHTPTEKRSADQKPQKFYELSFKSSQNSARDTTLSFSLTNCTKREVLRVTCKDLECGLRPQIQSQWSRIVGGSNSSPGAWPWQAALYKEGEFQCGATLISPQWLISAGHCFYQNEGRHWVARLGSLRTSSSLPSPYEQIREIIDVVIHPKYVDIGFINDIALLRLAEPVQLTDFIRPICLPPVESDVKDGTMCTVVGWGQLFEIGRIFPDTLQEVELPLISTTECRKRTLFFPLYNISDDMFCAGYDRGGRDACLGDSGGPLMCQVPDGRWMLYGVTSKGLGCARSNRPGVYTKVSRYLQWIENQMLVRSQHHGKMSWDKCKGHRCPLGECLPRSRICNGFVECSDGSDERDCWV